jgi:addiction module RelE/StbE family toxin
MIEVNYKTTFIKAFDDLEEALQNEIIEKIELLKSEKNHKQLKVHKLHGKFKDKYSFSVNYRYRIVFMYESKNEIVLMAVGDHEIYK